jgi:hypothetical protein
MTPSNLNQSSSTSNPGPSTPNPVALRSQIAEAVEQSWPQFAAGHPSLARVIDAQVIHDYVAQSLADDAAFQQAYRAAVEASVAAGSLGTLVRRFVDVAIARIV